MYQSMTTNANFFFYYNALKAENLTNVIFWTSLPKLCSVLLVLFSKSPMLAIKATLAN